MVGADYPERNFRILPEELQKDRHHWEAKAFEERKGRESERKKQEKIPSPQVMRKRVTDMITSNTIHLPLAKNLEHSERE
jgi:hypothetical protein